MPFTRCLVRFRKRHPVFRRRRWFQGRQLHGSGIRDIGWFKTDGGEMSEEDWKIAFRPAFVDTHGRSASRLRPDQCLSAQGLVQFQARRLRLVRRTERKQDEAKADRYRGNVGKFSCAATTRRVP